MKHRSKRRALEIILKNDYEEEDEYSNLTNRRKFDDDVVIENTSNDNDKDGDSNCSNSLCARDEDMNVHDEQKIIPILSSRDLGLGSSDNESDSSFSTTKNHKTATDLSDSKFSLSGLSLVSQCESKDGIGNQHKIICNVIVERSIKRGMVEYLAGDNRYLNNK